jgi:PBP1b-binding outer membrane lipoprotein LpoB
MHQQSKSLVSLVFVAVLLQGCNDQQVDPAKVQADVTKAEAAGQKNIIDAQAKLDQVVAQNNKDLAGVQADAQKDAANNPNTATPAASADIAKARANGEIKVADAQFDVDKAKAEGEEKVAEARCETQVGDANKTCKSNAKATYDSAVAAAKAKNDAEHAAHK